jgi:hypothetical protein
MGTTAQNMQLTRWYFVQDAPRATPGGVVVVIIIDGETDLGAKRETAMQLTTLAGRKQSVTNRREQIVQFPHHNSHLLIFALLISFHNMHLLISAP